MKMHPPRSFGGPVPLLALALTAFALAAPVGGAEFELVEVRKIWDQAPHNAFTDLIRWNDAWWCVFREGQGHVSPDGALRVITSRDGKKWESAALLTSPTSDLRDAKITLTPDGKLMLSGCEAIDGGKRHQSLVWFSADGRTWSERHEVGDPDFWLWRTTWHGKQAYGIGYGCRADNRGIRLYVSQDGRQFKTLVKDLGVPGYPNETSLLFGDDGTAYCLLRRDGTPASALLGAARPPYTEWTWKDLRQQIGGPHWMRIPDGRRLAVVRLYAGGVRSALCRLDPAAGALTELVRLPSGGDTSYAGLAWHADRLWVSYYSSHEGKTAIYFAELKPAP